MKRVVVACIFIAAILGLALVFLLMSKQDTLQNLSPQGTPVEEKPADIRVDASDTELKDDVERFRRIDLSRAGPTFRFSLELPESWMIQSVPESEALAIINPARFGEGLDQSEFFIKHFRADRFLTLSTVDILAREEFMLNGHAAVRYDIEKKAGVSNFLNQPAWRNIRHIVTDVRFAPEGQTIFYVIAANPELDQAQREKILSSIQFHNDTSSFAQPLPNLRARVLLKPFGLYVDSENSPVDPERFAGYHTAIDLEPLPTDDPARIQVKALCGGPFLSKRQAAGYGGVAVQSCVIGSTTVTVIYGHLRLGSVAVEAGEYLSPGDIFAELGTAFSTETDDERQHLHLGVYRGPAIDVRGYVQSEAQLADWIDPLSLFTAP